MASYRIYLASSWRNDLQQDAVKKLRRAGHNVYDFHNPEDAWNKQWPSDGSGGFQWSSIDSEWEDWSPWSFTMALSSQTAIKGYEADFGAMEAAEVGVLLLPCGRSAHIEAGYFAGHPDKSLYIVIPELPEPELMYNMADGIFLSIDDLIQGLRG